MKIKYWYRTDITSCVICGVETKTRYRVYIESEKGFYLIDTACDIHF